MAPSSVNGDKYQNFNTRKAMKSNIGTNEKDLRKVLIKISNFFCWLVRVSLFIDLGFP